jgi:hypothetical protein
MSYTALGASFSVSTPWGSQSISIPIEQMAHDAAVMAFDAAWPPLKQRLQQELPGLINQGMDVAYQRLQQELPGIMDMAVQEVQPDLRAEIDRAISIGTKRLVLGVTILSTAIVASTFLIIRKRR